MNKVPLRIPAIRLRIAFVVMDGAIVCLEPGGWAIPTMLLVTLSL